MGAQAENESGPLVLIHTTPRPVFFSLVPPPPNHHLGFGGVRTRGPLGVGTGSLAGEVRVFDFSGRRQGPEVDHAIAADSPGPCPS